jgi:hypothetical protein
VKGDNLPLTDHITRFCYGKAVEDGRPLGAAFLLRKEEEYLSVNWLECLNCHSRQSEITEIRSRYQAQFNAKRKDIMAVLNVEDVCAAAKASTDPRPLRVLHEPYDTDDSHSGIYDCKPDDLEVAELICSVVLDTYPVLVTP